MPTTVDTDYVKFGPCECDADEEDYVTVRAGDECPGDVRAQYRCRNCGMKCELVPADDPTDGGRGSALVGQIGWTTDDG